MMLSLCTKYWQFMLTQGVLMGVCMAFMQLPAMAAASQYFDKKRAAALGVVVAGSSIGGVVFPITLAKLLNETSVGFGWSVRITGFMMVPFMLFACFAVKSRLPPRKTSFFMVSVLRNRLFVVLVAAMFCAFLGMFTPIFYIPTYAVMHGMTPALASYMLAVINAASTFGRVLPGILADRWGRINMFAFAGLSTGLLVFCMNQATSTAGIVVYSVFFGFTSGMVISGASAAMSACNTNVQHMGTYMGMGMALGSIAVLIGPPVNGTLVTAHHGFVEVSIMSGTFCIVGGVIALGAKTLTPQGILGNV
jgi:MFS family permease